MSHLSPEQLSAYIDGALTDDDREQVEHHFATCSECLRELAEMARLQRQLETAMTHDPGDAYFESFPGRVAERIERERLAGLGGIPGSGAIPTRRSGPTLIDRIGGWLAGPRLAWVGTAAAVVIGAGVVFMIAREAPIRTPQSADIGARSDQVADRAAPAPGSATAPLAKREEGPPLVSLGRQGADAAASRASDEVGQKLSESKELDRTDGGSVVADLEAAGPTVAGKTSTAPLAPGESQAVEKARAREMRRAEGEEVASPEPQAAAQKTAPAPSAGMSNLTAPPKDAAARVKSQQARQAAEPLQASVTSRLCGTVRDDSGRPLSGAQVVIADLGLTATADASGRFCVEAPEGTHTLAAMAVGFTESRREVRVGTRASNVDFTLAAVSVLADAKSASRTAWPEPARALAEDAERGTRRAMTANSAASWDSVALQWSKTSATLSAGDALIRARANLADARYRAWKLSPTPGRTGVAAAALQAYLEVAPQGSERRKAQQRLEEVEQR